jgi:hypothetical protein
MDHYNVGYKGPPQLYFARDPAGRDDIAVFENVRRAKSWFLRTPWQWSGRGACRRGMEKLRKHCMSQIIIRLFGLSFMLYCTFVYRYASSQSV